MLVKTTYSQKGFANLKSVLVNDQHGIFIGMHENCTIIDHVVYIESKSKALYFH